MKNFSIYLVLLSSLILTSCGTSASYTSSNGIEDGIYYNPDYASLKASTLAEETYIAELTKETKASRIYSEPVDTIHLGETKNVELPLEPDKTYVVLLDGETYEERLNKFDDDSDLTFSINFEYNVGVGYNWGWNPYYRYYGPSYYWGWRSAWYDPWYYPYYDPWYYPWYGPSYAWGWYDPWYYPYYDPWYYPWYPYHPHVYPGYYPGPHYPGGHHHHDVVYGRRDLAHNQHNHNSGIHKAALSERVPDNRVRPVPTRTENSGISQIRGREIKRTTPGNVNREINNTRQSTINSDKRETATPQRTNIRNTQSGNNSDKYRQSSNNSNRRRTNASASYSTERSNTSGSGTVNRSNHSYQNNRSTQSSYSQSRSSGYSSGATSGRSSGSSSGSSRSTGGRR